MKERAATGPSGSLGAMIRRRWVVLVSFVVCFVGIAATWSLAQPATYDATVVLLVMPADEKAAAPPVDAATKATKALARISASHDVVEQALERLELDAAPQVDAVAHPSARQVDVTVRDESPERSAAVANAVGAEAVKEFGMQEGLEATVSQPAEVPRTVASPNAALRLALGLAAGLILGLAAAFIRDRVLRD